MARVYDQIYEGKWTPWAKGKGNCLQCCGCLMVHTIEFRVRAGEIQTRMTVDHRSTSASRKEAGITVTTRKPKTQNRGRV